MIDFRTLSGSEQITSLDPARTVIVGTGPSALALADGLIQHGQRVLLLESGGPEVLQNGFPAVSIDALPFTGAERRGRGFGGGSQLWAGQCLRFDALDFQPRNYAPFSGWPLRFDDLLPYYAVAEQAVGVDPNQYYSTAWSSYGLSATHWEADRIRIRMSVFAKDPQLLGIKKRLRTSSLVDVIYNATVTNLSRGGLGGFELLIRDEKRAAPMRILARRVVLAAGAIETFRLLAQPSGGRSEGLGGGPALGKMIHDHPNGFAATLHPSSPRQASRLSESFSLFFGRTGHFLPRLTPSTAVQQEKGILNSCAFPVYEWSPSSSTAALKEAQKAVSGARFDRALLEASRASFRHPLGAARLARARLRGRSTPETPVAVNIHLQMEQAIDPNNRLTLNAKTGKDETASVRLSWGLNELDYRSSKTAIDELVSYFDQHGIGEVRPSPALASLESWSNSVRDNQHLMGSARMGTNRQESVVDQNCEVHGTPNLYVSGGAVMPTGSFANPTLTMLALSYRLASRLAST